MIGEALVFLLSLACLIWAAHIVVDKTVLLEERLGLSKMVIGLTVVAVGTSLPELVISASAVVIGHPKIALGTVIGSNVFNVCVVLGLAALVFPLQCQRWAVRRNGIVMLLVTYGFCLWGYQKHHIDRNVGIVFIIAFVAYIIYGIASNEGELDEEGEFVGHFDDDEDEEDEDEVEDTHDEGSVAASDAVGSSSAHVDGEGMSKTAKTEHAALSIAKTFAALVVLCYSSYFLIHATMKVASSFLVGEYVISLAINALGTSLPELSVCIVAARRGETDIALGNIIGSNISNILLVLGLSSVLTTLPLKDIIIRVDFPFLVLTATLAVGFLFQPRGITRLKAPLLLLIYILFIWRCVKYPM